MPQTLFNEDSLGEEIKNQWGAHGAHYEVYQMVLKKAKEGRSEEKTKEIPDFYKKIDKKIYISGQITGLSLSEAKTLFNQAEFDLKQAGYFPVNPFKVAPYHPDKTWLQYMVEDVSELLTCTEIYKLPNWKNSKGAKVEILIFYLNNLVSFSSILPDILHILQPEIVKEAIRVMKEIIKYRNISHYREIIKKLEQLTNLEDKN